MTMIESPAYRAAVNGDPLTLTLGLNTPDGMQEIDGLSLTTRKDDWLVRAGMDVLLVKDWDIPPGPEMRFDTWIIRKGKRVIGNVRVPPQSLTANTTWKLSRALCVPEQLSEPDPA